MENINAIEVIKNRSYVACLYDGMAHPLVHFRVIMRALWPTFLAALLLAIVVALMPTPLIRCCAANVALLLIAIAMILQVNVQMRKLTELGYVPELKPRVLWKMIPQMRILPHLYWHYTMRVIIVALMSIFTALVIWLFSSAPAIVVGYLDVLTEAMWQQGDPNDLPGCFWMARCLAYMISAIGAAFGWLMIIFPVALVHGSVIAERQEREAANVELN